MANSAFAQKASKLTELGSAKKRDLRGLVKKWDSNRDGLLQPSEIPQEYRRKVLGAAKLRGLDIKKPLQIREFLTKPKSKSKGKKQNTKLAESPTPDDASPDTPKPTTREQNPKGFGKSARRTSKQELNDQPRTKSGKDDDNKRKGARLAAKSLMFQNDRNKNGRLEKSEWGRLKDNPSSADKNKDGSLSMGELTDHLAGYGSREEKPRPKYRTASPRETRRNSAGKRSYRFLTPHERLPDGLPDWFTLRDSNMDGQISLREYAPSLTAAKYQKFSQLDLNRDGFLIAKEYLNATK